MTRLQTRGLPAANQLLSHILESPALVAAVRELPGPGLRRLIDSVGLEDAAEVVALATTEQLEAVFDEELWQADPGEWEEQFDAARFALWLHAFSEAGEEALVERLTQLPVDFLTLAVHRLILVVDLESLAIEVSGGGEHHEQVEKALESCLCEEWEEFRLIARSALAFDELVLALFSLDREHHDLLRRILERCAAMSAQFIDDNGGLCQVLSSDQTLEVDVRAERDDRRAQKGYVSPADAHAFLTLARRGAGTLSARDPITHAYFRELDRTPTLLPVGSGALRASMPARLMRLIDKASLVEPTRPKGSSGKGRGSQMGSTSLLEQALAGLRKSEPGRYAERMEELGYLANVLISAPETQGRRLRPVEALEAAVAIASLGLELSLDTKARVSDEDARRAATALLSATGADQLFLRGYHDMAPQDEEPVDSAGLGA